MRLLHGKTQFGIPSRFLEEIPENVLKYISAKPAHFSPENRHLSEKPILSKRVQDNDYDGFVIGENIRHAKFGLGVIIDAKINGEHAHLHINFGKEGMKWLDTKFAKLEKT